MRKPLASLVLLFSVSALNAAPAINQLNLSAVKAPEFIIPAAPAPELEKKFDPDAPNMPDQLPTAPVRQDKAWLLNNIRWGQMPDDNKSYVWKSAVLRPELITRAYWGYKKYGVGHSFLVFTFGDGGFVSTEGKDEKYFTIGAEAWSKAPNGYNAITGLQEKYPLIWHATTLESFVDYVVIHKKKEVFLAEINIPAEKARLLFEKVMLRAIETNLNREMYDGISNSCTNNPVDLLNPLLPKRQRLARNMFSSTLPYTAVHAYVRKDVLKPFDQHMVFGPQNYARPVNFDAFNLR